MKSLNRKFVGLWGAFGLLTSIFGLALSPNALAAEEICVGTAWQSSIKPERVDPECTKAGTGKPICQSNLKKWQSEADAYANTARRACDKFSDSTTKMAETDITQTESLQIPFALAQDAGATIDQLIEQNRQLSQSVARESQANIKFLTNANQKKTYLAKLESIKLRPEEVKTLKFVSWPGISEADRMQLKATGEAANFLLYLLTDNEKQRENRSKISGIESQLSAALKKQGPPQTEAPPTETAKAGGGFDPSTLAALAGPLASLAPMLMQKNSAADSGLSSALTDPTLAGAGGAEGGSATSTAQTPLAAAKLDDDKKTGGNPATSSTPPPAGEVPFQPVAAGGESAPYVAPEESDITASGSEKSSSPAKPAAPSSAGGGDGGGGGNNGSAASKAEKDGRSLASEAANEEALQSFGGGGGGSLSANSDSSAASASPPVEDGLGDVLQDMESALNGNTSDLFGDDKAATSAGPDGESLFPRVRACYVRTLKRGLVLNGLGDRSESP